MVESKPKPIADLNAQHYTQTELRILYVLNDGKQHPLEDLRSQLQDEQDGLGTTPDAIHVSIFKLRKKLDRRGLAIRTMRFKESRQGLIYENKFGKIVRYQLYRKLRSADE